MFHGKRSSLGRRNSRARHSRGLGRAEGPRAQARPGTAWPCTLDLRRARALPRGSRRPRPSTLAHCHLHLASCVGASVPDAGPLSPRPGAAASAPFSCGSLRPGPGVTTRSVLLPEPAPPAVAQPTHPGLLVAPRYSPAPRDLRGCGLLQLQILREVKAKLPRDTLLNPKGTGLRKTPFSPTY